MSLAHPCRLPGRYSLRGLAGLAVALAAATLLASAPARAAAPDRFVASAGGVVLELSAPRADILRVRAGRSALPEDVSWAVSAEVRAGGAPLTVRRSGDQVEITTGALTARLDRRTLALTVLDAAGRVALADAPGRALAFGDKGSDGGGGFRLRKALAPDEHLFGLGDKTGPLDRRGGVFTLWNTDAFGFSPSTDPLYKSIPFLLGVNETGRPFGLLVDTTWRSVFDLGKTETGALAVSSDGGGADYYVMTGRDPKAIVQAYAFLTGTAPLTPLWALGFQQSHWSYMTQGEVQSVADRLRADRLPADVLWLDIDYQDRNRPFTVDTKAFPDLPKLVSDLARQDFHLVAITDLHIADAPGQGYRAYDSGAAADVFLRRPDGRPFVGPVWPGPSVFPDFSRSPVRDWWGRQFSTLVGMGMAGFWNDMNEPAVFETPSKTMPLDVVHRIDEPGFAARSASHAEMHNVYGLLNTRATYEGVRRLAPDRRPFVMTRASYAGGQRYAATWTGDNVSSWAHLSLSTVQLVSLGLSGFSYAGDDIGGFAGDAPSPELLTRWIEVGAFNPLFRDHYQKDKPAQEPWVHGPEQEAIRRNYIEARYRLLPYLYALADQNSRTGLPLMRPVFLEHPAVLAAGEHLGGTDGQFMLGGDLLVAPPRTWESAAAYPIPLPGPGWFDYWTGQRVTAAKTVETPRLDRLPVFVRPGAILPRQPLVQSTAQTPKGPLELAVYAGPDCRGALYLDDGVSFAYQRGDYLRQTVTCDARSLTFSAREGRFHPWWTGLHVVLHGWEGAAPVVRWRGGVVPTRLDAASGTLSFDLPDMAGAERVSIGPAGS